MSCGGGPRMAAGGGFPSVLGVTPGAESISDTEMSAAPGELRKAVAEINEILAEMGEPATCAEELERGPWGGWAA